MPYTNIDDPSVHFQVETYTGAGANTSVTFSGNSDLKPDFLWLKNRTAGYAHATFDSNRNLGSAVNAPFLEPNATSAENSNQNWWNATNYGINTDGFQFGSVSEHNLNNLGSEYVAWAWKANGGTTSSNTDGTITSTVQANQDAGFSIVTWTGNENSSATVGHGLGVKPDMVFFKRRNATYNWVVYCGQLGIVGGNNMFAYLNLTNAAEQGAGFNFTSTTITPTNGAPTNSGLMLAYCFAEKQGYSKFGSYVGNGNANGPFIYTGFKPAWIMIKDSESSGDNWQIVDTKRDPYNPQLKYVQADNDNAEGSFTMVDILSNGFKLRSTYFVGPNVDGHKTIYMAFAENPFTTSTGIPTTAR